MSDKFQQYVAAARPAAPAVGPDEKPQDDPARSDSYRAVRRVRTFAFPDVWFTDHTGLGQAFQWAHLRRMVRDAAGTRLMLIWPDGEVTLTGRHLDQLHEDIQRRIISEFFQVTPGLADAVPAGEPVVTSLRVGLPGENADAGGLRPPGLSLVVADDTPA